MPPQGAGHRFTILGAASRDSRTLRNGRGVGRRRRTPCPLGFTPIGVVSRRTGSAVPLGPCFGVGVPGAGHAT
eukprot:11182636-Lingulodinium_polyedra.AAC.1